MCSYAQSSKKNVKKHAPIPSRRLDVDLGEDGDVAASTDMDEDEAEEDEGEVGTIPLSTMLDGGAEASADDSASEEGTEDGESEGEDQLLSDEDVAELSDSATSKLNSFIVGLYDKKRKAEVFEENAVASKVVSKRRILSERTEAGAEGQFVVPNGEKGPT